MVKTSSKRNALKLTSDAPSCYFSFFPRAAVRSTGRLDGSQGGVDADAVLDWFAEEVASDAFDFNADTSGMSK